MGLGCLLPVPWADGHSPLLTTYRTPCNAIQFGLIPLGGRYNTIPLLYAVLFTFGQTHAHGLGQHLPSRFQTHLLPFGCCIAVGSVTRIARIVALLLILPAFCLLSQDAWPHFINTHFLFRCLVFVDALALPNDRCGLCVLYPDASFQALLHCFGRCILLIFLHLPPPFLFAVTPCRWFAFAWLSHTCYRCLHYHTLFTFQRLTLVTIPVLPLHIRTGCALDLFLPAVVPAHSQLGSGLFTSGPRPRTRCYPSDHCWIQFANFPVRDSMPSRPPGGSTYPKSQVCLLFTCALLPDIAFCSAAG